MALPSRYVNLPDPMKQEYGDFVGHLSGSLRLGELTCKDIATKVICLMDWARAELGYESSTQINAGNALDFLATLTVGRGTIVNYRAAFMHLFRWHYMHDRLDAQVITKFELSKPPKRFETKEPEAFTDGEIRMMFDRIHARWPYDAEAIDKFIRGKQVDLSKVRNTLMGLQHYTIMWTVLETGVRVSELHRMTVHSMDPVNESIPVIGKYGKYREIPYPESLRPKIRRWLAHRALIMTGVGMDDPDRSYAIGNGRSLPLGHDHEYLWLVLRPHNIGDHVKYKTMADWINWYNGRTLSGRKRGELKDLDAIWHKFRKTFATRSYNEGMDLGVLSKILGHKSPSTTAIYLGIDRQRILREAKVFEAGRTAQYEALDGGVLVVTGTKRDPEADMADPADPGEVEGSGPVDEVAEAAS